MVAPAAMRPPLVTLLVLLVACSGDQASENKPAAAPVATPPARRAEPPAAPPASPAPPTDNGEPSVDAIIAKLPADFRAERKSTSDNMTNVKVWEGDSAMLWGIVHHGDDELALATAKASMKPSVQAVGRIDHEFEGQTKIWARFGTYVMNGMVASDRVEALRTALQADEFLPAPAGESGESG